jgi:hypothetical protein
VIIAITVVSSLASAGSKSRGAECPSSAGTSTPTPAATSPAMSDSAQQFVSDLQSSSLLNISSSMSCTQIASYGRARRQAGRPRTAAISYTESTTRP